ncbi:M20 metallopeptidase family protein [Sphaerisporangium viridialbum]|uniref:M20 metallopeptidase family protein n=1 Tax=Sphaerisporangium viridialbum TaxID=46189 RepID=UPI003C79499B
MRALSQQLEAALRDEFAAAREIRRYIHARPDLSGHEHATTRTVIEQMPAGLRVEEVAGSGAIIRVGGEDACVAVRTELDALPVTERTLVEWAAGNGAMHACGHDVHLSAGIALARAVHRVGAPIPLLLVLQPREETAPSGAMDILGSRALERHQVRAMIGAHVQPLLASGEVASTPGTVNASADEFTVRMLGVGGHAAYPHLGPDPVLALSLFITAAQQLVARDIDPMLPAVVSIGEIRAGSSPNVRPDHAVARGTLRSFDLTQRELLHRRLKTVASGVAESVGCKSEVHLDLGEPALHNDPRLAKAAAANLERFGLSHSNDLRSCGADDFAHYAQRFPSLMMFVGTGAGSGKLHSADFLASDEAVDHTALALAAGYLAACTAFTPT